MVNQFTDPALLRKKRLQINFTDDELERIKLGARLSGRTIAGFCRSALRLYCDEIERTDERYHDRVVLRAESDEARPRFNKNFKPQEDK